MARSWTIASRAATRRARRSARSGAGPLSQPPQQAKTPARQRTREESSEQRHHDPAQRQHEAEMADRVIDVNSVERDEDNATRGWTAGLGDQCHEQAELAAGELNVLEAAAT